MRYELIQPFIERGLVSEQEHPEDADVRIFNYTQKCQFEREWNDVTRQCRGLIMNVRTGEILARPFPKFFNYGEHVSNGWAIPTSKPEVYEKLDGSLGILYSLNGKPWIATRGSFTSDQAQWATKWWRENIGEAETTEKITCLFEIIYPANRIVVNYDFSGLVYLASLLTESGADVTIDPILMFGAKMRTPKKIPYTDMEALSKLDEPNSEGFVLFYPEENVRMKIKFPEYVRLHKLITGVSEIAIWEHLREGKGLNDLLEKVPDEFYAWVSQVQRDLKNGYSEIEESAKGIYESVRGLPDRKSQALNIQKMTDTLAGIVFAMLDEKDYAPLIWRMVRPRGRGAFKVDIDS